MFVCVHVCMCLCGCGVYTAHLSQSSLQATNYQSTDIQRTSLTQRRSLFATFGTATAVAAVGVSVGVFLSWKGFFPSSIFQRLSHLISNKV